MSLAATILTDVTSWGSEAESLLTNALPVVGILDDTLKSITAVSTVLTAWNAKLNTPAMQQASSAEKVAAFKDHINTYLGDGNEAALETLMASS